MDITQLILDDHHEQRRQFAIMEQIDRGDTGVLSAVWGRLATFLELHAAAEEEIFYPALLQVGLAARRTAGVEGETLDAIHDHNEIKDAIAEVARNQVGTDEWFAAVGAANLANSDHMAEEEREGLTDFRRLAGLQRPPSARGRLRRLRGTELRRSSRRGQETWSPTCAKWRGKYPEADPSVSAASSDADAAEVERSWPLSACGRGHARIHRRHGVHGSGSLIVFRVALAGAAPFRSSTAGSCPIAGLASVNDVPGCTGRVIPDGRVDCDCGGPWFCRGSRRWWCRRGSGPGSSPTGG